ncbi:hypothetical protein [Bradyrhizobium sp. I71]|uniref:hypothetical protein n=1 Tax=Bradyrhizobium sp. I71 TaxID=2590772 RepID=UPI001EF9519A|nr:hypothetical protein [Bradyrhizobium sp. I71]ULK95966.1 hypothetical protein FJV43_24815 [Bradyrhizobium sp. I71]
MSLRDLEPTDEGTIEPASTEVQFALVIARMLETVKSHPEQMRQLVYDLARYKLQEQFTHADAKEVRRSKQALEAAIRGVEEFSRQQVDLPPPADAPALAAPEPPRRQVRGGERAPATTMPADIEISRASPLARHALWSVMGRTAALLLVVGLVVVAVQQRERLASLAGYVARGERQVAAAPPPAAPAVPVAPVVPDKPKPMRPTDYGVYALVDDKELSELHLLPGRAPDARVAVSAAFKIPEQAGLPSGRPKFIVFRREAATNVPERVEVRVVAKIAREFSAEATAKKPDAGDDAWVIRSFSYPFRASPLPDTSEMYELHSEDPALELPPGGYALILKSQSYYFSVKGEVRDPRQCIERIVAANGTFYTDCKKP